MTKCESCKPTKSDNEWTQGLVSDSEVGSTRRKCHEEYQQVEDCMKQSQGSISKCNLQWIQFRKCFNDSKE
jgi:hypothetical protein